MAESSRRRLYRSALLVIVITVVVAAGCSSSRVERDGVVEGRVTEVSGDLTHVDYFVILDEDGNSHQFTPAEGLTFDGGPVGHLREHVVTGDPVVVTFETGADGAMVATEVSDAG